MVSCYVTGAFPKPEPLITATRAYERKRLDEKELDKSFEEATLKVIQTQMSANVGYIIDGMLKWKDLLRPFAENLIGIKIGSLARWFNNNTFYRKPVIVDKLSRNKSVIEEVTYIKYLPRDFSWKAILPAPYTFLLLSENCYYKDKTELLFDYAKILREEIESLAKLGFKYVQLSDPALVYKPTAPLIKTEQLKMIKETLTIAVKGIPVKTCLQTFFGDFSQILPEALDFPVDHLGIDLYETNIEKLKDYDFEKGLALGLMDSRNSLMENQEELVTVAKEIIKSVHCHRLSEVFVCPNCDLEFLPWKKAERKIKLLSHVAERLRMEFNE